MRAVAALLTPRDAATDTRPEIRVVNLQDRRVTAMDSEIWFPAITALPTRSIKLFDGDFSSDVEPGTASLTIQLDKVLVDNIGRFQWAGAKATIYLGEAGDAWPFDTAFVGKIDRFEADGSRLKLTATVDTEPFDTDAMTLTYAGTTGIEGGADLKNKLKPWVFGRARDVEPVLINAVDSVYQFSAYGPIQAVNVLYERGAEFEAALADYATYASLVAATIPPGHWATCLAYGLIRLGAPAYGVITGDVDGHKESGTWLRMTGEIISCIATRAGVDLSRIDTDSLDALDAAISAMCPDGGKINLVLTDQTSVLDIARRLAKPCNAQAGVSWLGALFTPRVAIGTPALTLDAQARQLPLVSSSIETDVRPPFWKVEMGADRAWRPHTPEEISMYAQWIDRGPYSATESYREGNVVTDQNMQWRYVNIVASTGHAPPTLPTTVSLYWEAVDPKLGNIEEGADVTLSAQITIFAPANPTINVDSTGSVVSGQLPRTVARPGVTRNGISIAADDNVTYAIQNTLGGIGTVTVDKTNGSSTKGQQTVPSAGFTGAGSYELVVSVDGIGLQPIKVIVSVSQAAPTSSGGTGSKTGSTAIDDSLSSTSYVQVGDTITVTKATGETIRATYGGSYYAIVLGGGSRYALMKWQYAPAGTGFASPTDFGSPLSGSPATYDDETYSQSPGSVACNQSVAPANGNYDVRLVAAMSAAGGAVSFNGETAYVNVGP